MLLVRACRRLAVLACSLDQVLALRFVVLSPGVVPPVSGISRPRLFPKRSHERKSGPPAYGRLTASSVGVRLVQVPSFLSLRVRAAGGHRREPQPACH